MSEWVVILAGGVGSRFWPVSTPERPKQLLPLVDEKPLLLNTIERMAPLAGPERTLILTSALLAPAIRRLVPEIPEANCIIEPRPAGTAAALTWAATTIATRDGADAVMISVHADWAIQDAEGFRAALRRAVRVAATRRLLVTVGIVPERPDPGFGYIRRGDRLDEDVYRVAQFVEKPDRARAEAMVREGFLWNSGIFVWRVDDFLREVNAHTPEVAGALAACAGDVRQFFDGVKNVPVDVGVLERSDRVAVMPGAFGWDDVGTWAALLRVRRTDRNGNAALGQVHAVDARRNVVHAEEARVVLYGVSDLVVVVHGSVVLVTTVDRAADLKQLVDALPAFPPRPGLDS